ncbi:putative small GTPase, EF-hand domain, EF-hand domain pair, EF hand associated, type-1, MIRO [Helianthus annuus]|uniref:Mitochondrial Rho GTPase n=1 Tax=Helianthus annuus TaxID=4232 RepID=A0A9K3HQ50_HELAN|nr:putative small GTPase, EF-hand domain pair, P-loop containing nucleoside triphosphate hydrolase [Helianthus annuus]KAJ0509878.1 putative small GTPase, EF-hand domain, EF-hand domain pair, EF hand associated, type-1, MIRO [Helianthus annuus]KAJ0685883.1 putative small GTPase, EF-hand domain, EF-hand domain pair, EF hand associated, type-1, MIRO [Helianthus annuus]KAJ0689754.1 putative small GTPase, EF-hand domain, EF-hand domain pair, EF hand associated, type-1, MIRO [Helianthus annuus]KAJ087
MSGSSVTGGPIPGRRTTVRVVVAGDRGTGKSSLIAAAASERFPESVSPVLPPTRLPADYYPDAVPVTIIDTASSLEGKAKLEEELKRADAVVLTYACDKPETLSRLQTFWIPEVRRLKVKAPVIVVGCKLDLRDEHYPVSLEQVMAPIMQQFREIETCIECSAANLVQVPEVFYYAQKAVLHPTAPLFDQESQTLRPRCIRALKRIFILCDQDMDGALNDSELNEFQVKCFNAPLQPAEIVGVKRVVQEKVPEGVNDLGLTLTGFLFLHALFIEKGRLETTWAVLRKFGYNNDIELRKENLPVPSKRAPDQSVELTNEALDFLMGIFSLFDSNNDGALQDSELNELFSTAPESPWDEAPYKNSVERTESGDIRLSAFLSQWALMTLLDPAKSLAYLIYLGYTNDPATALRVTRKRTVDVKKQQSDRHVFQCFVFGPKNAGKSSLLSSFVGRPFQNSHGSSSYQSYTVNAVDQLRGTKKTLILHEILEDDVKQFLSSKESLAACDVAVFVYDSSDEYSLKRASEFLMDVARRGEDTGYGVPCLFVAAKDDLGSYPMATRDSEAVICRELKIDAPIRISVKKREMNNIFWRIVNAAERCHLSVPETEYGRNMKQYRRIVNRSLVFASVGAAAAVVALAAYRAYASRKSHSAS